MYSLAQRVAALDSRESGDVLDAVDHFMTVLAEVVSFGTETISEMPQMYAADADREMRRCHLLARLDSIVPELVTGPLARNCQYWISAQKPPYLPPNEPSLAPQHFRPVRENPPAPSAKPFELGLHTSTGFSGTQGMWRAYLDKYEGSAVPPPTWHVWALKARESATILEITTAADWTAFIERFPAEAGGLRYPDWRRVVQEYDAVHMTIRAIAAAQGVCFVVPGGITAPGYWDVESVFWLRWCFDEIRLVEVVGGPGRPHQS